MLEYLHLKNVGPAPEMELELAPRLNLLTGDNGLGKSFLLDIAWWALSRRWPWDVNSKLTSGRMARPFDEGSAIIEFRIAGKPWVHTQRVGGGIFTSGANYISAFHRREQAWEGKPGRPQDEALVVYAQVDGSFAVWDPARNYWRTQGNRDVQDRPPAYVFSPREVWDGLPNNEGGYLCNGLITDWANWQRERGPAFQHLSAVLAGLSPDGEERLETGPLTRISLDDARDIPTLLMPYGKEVPLLQASAGMRRIAALAYLLVWCWHEHLRAARLLDEAPAKQVVFLIDEVESHLHPRWQRTIAPALLNVVRSISPQMKVQLMAATHSPLVMASVEPTFDSEQDAWFDLDLVPGRNGSPTVHLEKRPWVLHGDAADWLTSEAFDLGGAGSLEREQTLERAAVALSDPRFNRTRAAELKKELQRVLPDTDDFWINWRAVGKAKGWLP